MTKWLRDFRLLPVVLIAVGCLFVLKTFGLLFDGGYTLGQRMGGANGALVVTTVPAAPVTQLRSPSVPLEMASAPRQGSKSSWMQEMFNYPGDITGSVPAPKPKEPEKQGPIAEPAPESKAAAGVVIAQDQPRSASPGERALLERLQERRQELDARTRELDLRETLLKAAEKKLEAQPVAAKAEDGKGPAGAPAAPRKEDIANARFKGVVTMYETMKPKEAAKIFDRLDIRVLIEVASQIKPQIMSAILAQMSAETAERLTVEMAVKTGSDRTLNPTSLPKIEGRSSGG